MEKGTDPESTMERKGERGGLRRNGRMLESRLKRTRS